MISKYETVALQPESLSEFRQVTLIWFFAAALRYREILIADGGDLDAANEQTSQAITFMCDTWACAQYLEAMLNKMPKVEAEQHWEQIYRNGEAIYEQAEQTISTMVAKSSTLQ
jgi:hypothetical protein